MTVYLYTLNTGHGSIKDITTPKAIEALKCARVCDLVCGDKHSLAIDAKGVLYSWGCGAAGRLGHEDENDRVTPQKVERLSSRWENIKSISAGMDNSSCINEEGIIYIWGGGSHGKLGLGNTQNQLVPRILKWKDVKAVKVKIFGWMCILYIYTYIYVFM